ncbi:alcohol oxidase [Cytidiella melzeri]|nr:alcohol oxidase [Cytidiella melzeri]
MQLHIWSAAVIVLSFCAPSLVRAALIQEPSQIPAGKVYDYIIAGAGAGGSVLANRLSESENVNVLLVEAGSSDYKNLNVEVPHLAAALIGSEFDWNFTTVPQPGLNGRSLPYTRGRVLGGSTAINFMSYSRGSKDDWNRWANVTDDQSWSWNSILPYAKKIEQLTVPIDGRNIHNEVNYDVHGHRGPVKFSTAGYRISTDRRILETTTELAEFPFNLDMNSGNTIGIGWTQLTIAEGERVSAASAYLDPVLARSNLDIVVNTHVTKLLQTGTSNGLPVFRGVQLSQPNSPDVYTLKATNEVIVSTGAVKTPQLLMLSGIGDSAELAALDITTIVDLPDVGKNLQDQPSSINSFTVNSTDTLDPLTFNSTFTAQQLALWQSNHTGQLGLPFGDQLGWFRLPSNSTVFETTPDPTAGPTSAHFMFTLFDGFIAFNPPFATSGNFFTALTVGVSPSSRGTITINSTSPFASPLISPGFLSTDVDIAVMRESIKSLRRFVAARAWDGWILNEFGTFATAQTDDEIDEYLRNTAIAVSHASCTASMGKTGSTGRGTGVLNSDLTVKGTVGLRVVDASVFPFIPASHTQAPVYIIAEKAADLIKASAPKYYEQQRRQAATFRVEDRAI